MKRKRVVVADDLAPVLSEVAALLRKSFDVVGQASDGRAALELTLQHAPDLVVLDITMPEMSGIEVARELRNRGNNAGIVFLTVHEDTDILKACQDAGGLGYVVKLFMANDLLRAMDEVLAGRTFTSSFPSQKTSP
ncbi:MAG TPA: response regulator transcription factor, partial [Candidatus Acidoferrales bacterium]|nr:response regulator transcription factor [Candidatus Acidoferrales bacterium]